MKKILLIFATLLVIAAVHLPAAAPEPPTTLTFGIVPQQAASKLAQLWAPLLGYLSEQTGYAIQFKTAPDIPEFERRLAAGEYDLAYMNPYHYTVFHRSPGYEAFAKEKDGGVQGIIVVRKDSPLQRLEDLQGQTLVFPSPAAFAASILPRASLARQGIAITPKYVASHDSVYLSVAKGLYSAGGGIQQTFANTAAEIRDQLRILWTTDTYTPHAIAAHPRVPATVIERVQQAMLSIDQDPTGRRLLEAINFKGIEAAQDKDWDDVRALNIQLLDPLISR